MLRLIATVSSALALAACATSAKFEAQMDALVGGPESAVIRAYGAPQSSYVLANGQRALTYTRSQMKLLPGMETTDPVVRLRTRHCAFSFVVSQAGTVESWRADGNYCRAK